MKKKAFNAYNHTQTYKNEWNDHLILNLINNNIKHSLIALKIQFTSYGIKMFKLSNEIRYNLYILEKTSLKWYSDFKGYQYDFKN